MLKIRLMRIGAKGRPFYRVVVVDERNKRNGAYLDLIGTYNPLTNPKEIKLDMKKIDEWLKKGAQKSDGLLRILKEAPQRHSKPKKESSDKNQESSKEKPTEAPVQESNESKVEEAPEATTEEVKQEEPVTETPAEEVAAEEPKVEEVVEEIKAEEKAEEVSTEAQPEEQIATEPEAPRNDEDGEEKKEEAAA